MKLVTLFHMLTTTLISVMLPPLHSMEVNSTEESPRNITGLPLSRNPPGSRLKSGILNITRDFDFDQEPMNNSIFQNSSEVLLNNNNSSQTWNITEIFEIPVEKDPVCVHQVNYIQAIYLYIYVSY